MLNIAKNKISRDPNKKNSLLSKIRINIKKTMNEFLSVFISKTNDLASLSLF